MDTGRRSFLAGASGTLFAFAALDWHAVARAAGQAEAAADGGDPALAVLTDAEAATVDAIASRIVPTDDLPGAHEAGVVFFVDKALDSFFATTRDDFMDGLEAFEADAAKTHGGTRFTDLGPDAQDGYLRRIENSEFFYLLRTWTILGLLASPKYGGNRGLVGWKLVGFEPAPTFAPPFGHYDRDYEGFEPYPAEDKA